VHPKASLAEYMAKLRIRCVVVCGYALQYSLAEYIGKLTSGCVIGMGGGVYMRMCGCVYLWVSECVHQSSDWVGGRPIQVNLHTHTYTHMYKHTLAHTCACTRTQVHGSYDLGATEGSHTHTNTHTHMHTYRSPCSRLRTHAWLPMEQLTVSALRTAAIRGHSCVPHGLKWSRHDRCVHTLTHTHTHTK
jgi:hypothetical protein